MRGAIVTLVAAAHVASGDVAWAGDGIPLAVSVGFAVERDVGNANGWFCDDPSLVEASLETRGETNVWIVKGVRAGATQCRVGTDVTRASYVFDVTLKPATKSVTIITPTPRPAAKPAVPAATTTKPAPIAKPAVKPPTKAKRRPKRKTPRTTR